MTQENIKALWASLNQHEWPTLLDFSSTEHTEQNTIVADVVCHIAPELSWFAGHFPEQAVLPGVVQTHWAGELSAALFPVGTFHQVTNLKFKSMIMPETDVVLNLCYSAEKNTVKFCYASADSQDVVFTTGSLWFQ